MKKITFPLKLETKGPEIADLQSALLLLNFTIAMTEKTRQDFGSSTKTAVSEFQTSQNLPATGEVDSATADALNAVLTNKGAFERTPGDGTTPTPNPPTDDPLFSIHG